MRMFEAKEQYTSSRDPLVEHYDLDLLNLSEWQFLLLIYW